MTNRDLCARTSSPRRMSRNDIYSNNDDNNIMRSNSFTIAARCSAAGGECTLHTRHNIITYYYEVCSIRVMGLHSHIIRCSRRLNIIL